RRSAVSSWTPRQVLEAAAASQWCPDGAVEVLTDDYRLIRYPDWALDPAFPAAQVTRSRSERTTAELIAEVAAGASVGQARGGLVGLARDPAAGHRGGAACRGRQADRRGADPGPRAVRRRRR